jgi:hypothetical protein
MNADVLNRFRIYASTSTDPQLMFDLARDIVKLQAEADESRALILALAKNLNRSLAIQEALIAA